MNKLHYRILEISKKKNLSHIGSCISSVDIINEIYERRKPDDPVLIGNSHCGLALYVVLEVKFGHNAEDILNKYGIHVTYAPEYGIYASGGSLGQLETVAVGMAIADRNRNVWLLSSDGGSAEGAFWEALGYKSEMDLYNLKWIVSANGYAAYRKVNGYKLSRQIAEFDTSVDVRHTHFQGIPFLSGLDAHYKTMTDEDWKWVQENKPKEEVV